jgi:hypothetical protein
MVCPERELFRFHTALVSELGGCLLGRRLYETLLVWETDPSLREDELGAAFADVDAVLRTPGAPAREARYKLSARARATTLPPGGIPCSDVRRRFVSPVSASWWP